jgi:acetyltransferase-like isoleucine patch superfamily enzyme
MVKIYHLFGGISQFELENIIDEFGFITTDGKKLLERIGVKTEAGVSIGRSTLQNLVSLYNAWKSPGRSLDKETDLLVGKVLRVPEDDVLLWNKVEELRQSYKMGIKIGRNTKIGDDVLLGIGVSIGENCEISSNCELDMFSTIQDRVFLGKSVFTGKDSDVESGCRIMDRVTVSPRSVVKKNSIIKKNIMFKENIKYQ